jgi:hypothetical protein
MERGTMRSMVEGFDAAANYPSTSFAGSSPDELHSQGGT